MIKPLFSFLILFFNKISFKWKRAIYTQPSGKIILKPNLGWEKANHSFNITKLNLVFIFFNIHHISWDPKKKKKTKKQVCQNFIIMAFRQAAVRGAFSPTKWIFHVDRGRGPSGGHGSWFWGILRSHYILCLI